MQEAKNLLWALTAFVAAGLLVILIDQMYPTNMVDKTSLQAYSSKNVYLE